VTAAEPVHRDGPAGATPGDPPDVAVDRTRLVEQLQSSRATAVSLSAPGGYGKTTVLRQWASLEPRETVWVDVPRGRPSARVVAEAIGASLDPDPAVALPATYDQATWFDVALPALGGRLRARPEPCLLVLDDATDLRGPAAEALLETVVASLPADSRLAVASRMAPLRALRRLRTSARLLELGPTELALAPGEASRLVTGLGVDVDDARLLDLMSRTEGWPVAVYLVGLSLRSSATPAPAPAPAGHPPLSRPAPGWVEDYLQDELVDPLDAADRQFLLRCSVLDQLDAQACAAVALEPAAGAVLRRLADQNTLLVRIDAAAGRYRLHQLLADHLRESLSRLDPAELAACHARASRWFLEQGDLDAAVEHAAAAGDDDWFAALVWTHAGVLLGRGQLPRVRAWLALVDEPRVERSCPLALTAAHVASHEGDIKRFHRLLVIAEGLCRRAGRDAPHRTDVVMLQALAGREGIKAMVQQCSTVIAAKDPDDPWLTLAHFLRGVGLVLSNHVPQGAVDLQGCLRLADAHDVPIVAALACCSLAQLAAAAGDLDEAERLLARARRIVDELGLSNIATTAPIYTALASVQAASGDVEEARASAAHALRLTAMLNDVAPWYAVQGRLNLALAYVQIDDAVEARQLVHEAKRLYSSSWRAPLLDQLMTDTLASVRDSTRRASGANPLTLAEMRVLQYLPSHLSYPEIAEELVVSRHTVKSQAMSVFRKLGVSSRSACVRRARELALLPPVGAA
jgi:LuxR family maltose regulon positive regulatory protein